MTNVAELLQVVEDNETWLKNYLRWEPKEQDTQTQKPKQQEPRRTKGFLGGAISEMSDKGTVIGSADRMNADEEDSDVFDEIYEQAKANLLGPGKVPKQEQKQNTGTGSRTAVEYAHTYPLPYRPQSGHGLGKEDYEVEEGEVFEAENSDGRAFTWSS